MYFELAVFVISFLIWMPLYKWTISRWVGDSVVKRCESGEIDLNYLLDEGGVFDELASRVVTLFKQHMVAEMGQLSRAAQHDPENVHDPVTMGLNMSGEILKGVGMKKPPAILQYKLAQALGQLANNPTNPEPLATFDPAADFYKK
tara:strand:+ start:110 stop:547 length:438 start_codon:yes stop_codon:yes gene_type:complete